MKYDDSQKRITAIRLKECRNKKGLSHENLAKELIGRYGIKISSAVLKNYEVADKYHAKFEAGFGMNIQYLYTLADFYNVSTDYLLGKTEEESPDILTQAINIKTGLSGVAIKKLLAYNLTEFKMNYEKGQKCEIIEKFDKTERDELKPEEKIMLNALNTILESGFCDDFLFTLAGCLTSVPIIKDNIIGHIEGFETHLTPDLIQASLSTRILLMLEQIKEEKGKVTNNASKN